MKDTTTIDGNSSNPDKFGIICSCLCFAHCISVPMLIYLFPSFTSFIKNEFIHIGLLLTVFITAIFSFYNQYKIHKQLKPGIFFGFGLTLLALALILEESSLHLDHWVEIVVSFLGSFLLVIGHILNIRINFT